jgi:hypothetical protein
MPICSTCERKLRDSTFSPRIWLEDFLQCPPPSLDTDRYVAASLKWEAGSSYGLESTAGISQTLCLSGTRKHRMQVRTMLYLHENELLVLH